MENTLIQQLETDNIIMKNIYTLLQNWSFNLKWSDTANFAQCLSWLEVKFANNDAAIQEEKNKTLDKIAGVPAEAVQPSEEDVQPLPTTPAEDANSDKPKGDIQA